MPKGSRGLLKTDILPAWALALLAVLQAWFAEMPRPSRMLPQKRPTTSLPLLAASNAAARQHGLHLPGAKATTIDRWVP